ncbi:hypothetical protein BOTBODRAFT_55162 [Botryobasidium botryosum FD-172 SS1]|uniref:DRBM domain-containing protein n=1 Tax=Botryobasidium botryosum (strain FD-172 SS1) TaxID=930990 RepID=A0A067MFM0_BOTB1|nr:hypothetical protein BOTBODRAFT_55162 [Botryobasidium botryosum FD-172 SS1]
MHTRRPLTLRPQQGIEENALLRILNHIPNDMCEHSLMRLNNYLIQNHLMPKDGLKWALVAGGPPHALIWYAQCTVNGFLYNGTGPSKIAAKNQAAARALAYFAEAKF